MIKEKNTKPKSLITIIMPCFKAENFISKSLLKVMDVMEQVRHNYEIICVVDGMVDDTFKKAQSIEKRFPKKIKVVGYLTNLGKGHAVRFGMAQARGDIVGFIDAGFDINPNGISMLLEHFEWYKADIVVGSKRHPASKVVYPWQRKVMSVCYQILARVLFGLRVRDTQAGLKFFKRDVLEKVLPRLLVKKFAFDIEMLSVSYYLGFKRIFEAPVEMKMDFGGGASTIINKGFMKTVFSMVWDTMAVYYRLKILHYYDDNNKKNWITPEYLMLKSE